MIEALLTGAIAGGTVGLGVAFGWALGTAKPEPFYRPQARRKLGSGLSAEERQEAPQWVGGRKFAKPLELSRR